jgi:hypothetical protein
MADLVLTVAFLRAEAKQLRQDDSAAASSSGVAPSSASSFTASSSASNSSASSSAITPASAGSSAAAGGAISSPVAGSYSSASSSAVGAYRSFLALYGARCAPGASLAAIAEDCQTFPLDAVPFKLTHLPFVSLFFSGITPFSPVYAVRHVAASALAASKRRPLCYPAATTDCVPFTSFVSFALSSFSYPLFLCVALSSDVLRAATRGSNFRGDTARSMSAGRSRFDTRRQVRASSYFR